MFQILKIIYKILFNLSFLFNVLVSYTVHVFMKHF